MSIDHEQPMRTALSLARSQLGRTWPNPAVGAVLLKNDVIIGQAATANGGRPHAETIAIAQAGSNARGATLYVTLEPCSHHGKTPPCSQAIIDAGIARVVIACRDPNPKVDGQGIAQLKAAGIEVIEGICTQEAQEINRGFFSVITRGRPFISLKIATSQDGKITHADRSNQWITSEKARTHGQLLRSQYDAIATGIGTVLADDPLLTCRIPGMEDKSPVRVVFDSALRLPPASKLVQSADQVPLWVISNKISENSALKEKNVRIFASGGQSRLDLVKSVQMLAEQGITRLLVEAGAELSSAFLQSGLVDRMYWFKAPLVIGNEGLAAFTDEVAQQLADSTRWRVASQLSLPPDNLDILECLPVS